MTYTYDGNGLRVEKSSGKLYWRDIFGNAIAETDSSGSTTNANYHEYVFMAGRRIASRDGLGNVNYYYADALGSTVTLTDGGGNACYETTYTPYGEEHATMTSCSTNYKFAGYEQDSETGLYYAFARYYNPRLGRFMTPDPLMGDIRNPQTLNRYAYVANNPLNFVDPLGMSEEEEGPPETSCTVDGAQFFGGACDFFYDDLTGGFGGGGGGGNSTNKKLQKAIKKALKALKNPKCQNLFASNVDATQLLDNLNSGIGTNGGAIFVGSLGAPTLTNGQVSFTVANTEPILGTSDTGSSTFIGAVITFNSDPRSPFNTGWQGTSFGSSYSSSTLNAAVLIHELGHAANDIYGPNSSQILDDGPDVPNGTAISGQNLQAVLNDCFK